MDKDQDVAPAGGRQQVRAVAPAALATFDGSGVTAERLRRELDIASFNEQFLLAPAGYFLIGFDGAILQVNLAGAAMLGIARANPRGHAFRAMVTYPFQPDFDAVFSRALNSNTALSCRVRMRRAGHGDAFHATLHASADASGQACRVVLETADGGQEAVARNEERFRRVVHSAEQGIWEIDAGASTTFVNPRMAAMLGYSMEDMLGRPFGAFIAGDAVWQQASPERHHVQFTARDGATVPAMLASHPIFNAAGHFIGSLGLVTALDAQQASPALAWRQASFDALTGLHNRHMFMDRLALEIRKAQRGAGCVALLAIDLDAAGGERLLAEAGRRVAGCIRSTDTAGRLGGDAFAVILAGLDRPGSVERIARQLLAVLAEPFDLDGASTTVCASIGIALYPADAGDIDRLAECADESMYVSQRAGGGVTYFTPGLQEAARTRQQLSAELQAAMRLGQFEIAYQPIVSLTDGAVHQAEALLRWRHPQRGLLAPVDFLACAEADGLSIALGDWMLREVAEQVLQWQRSIAPGFQVCINLSPAQFAHDAAPQYLARLALPAHSIVIEITESLLLGAADQVAARLAQYRALGLQVSLDDFGTGYAALAHLNRFAMDYLKIDCALVARLEEEGGDLAYCEAIIAMAHKLGLKVVAEGVETALQRALLVDAGCDLAQGHVFARPMPASQFEAVVKTGMPAFAH